MGVVIGIVTFRRPEALARLLAALSAVRCSKPTSVLVVDNDPEGSARAVAEAAGTSAMPVHYLCEPEPGIAAARNRVVAESAGAEFLAFIDDDEVPSAGWLERLLAAQAQFQADLVAGPVLSVVEDGPGWIARHGVLDRPRRPSGAGPFLASSANLLLRLDTVGRLDSPLFDLRFGLTGGSDTMLSLRVQQAGLRMAWADEAVVMEYFPAARANIGWILRRAYRNGTTMARCELALSGSHRNRFLARLSRGAKGGVHAALAVVHLPVAGLRGRAGAVGALRRLMLGAGMVAGALGMEYVEYRRIPLPARRG